MLVKMVTILNLKPEIAEQLHPLAAKWFSEISAAIEKQLETDGLTVDDVEAFLSDDDRNELQRQKNEIQTALLGCVDPASASPGLLFNSGLGPPFLMMQLRSFSAGENIKSLLRKVYEGKVAAKPETVRKQDASERRSRAFKALSPPTALARKYLANPDEQLRFEMSINGAVDAYLEAGELYGWHEKAKKYRQCMEMIENRQREEARKQRAQSAADAYNRRLNERIRELTRQLHGRERDLSSHFRATVQDKRYSGHSFDYILSQEQSRELDLILASAANRLFERLCPEELRKFIVLPLRYARRYYPLPSASFSFEEVPCLDFSFDIFAVLCAEIWLKPEKKRFDGFEFALPSIEGKNGLSLLKDPQFLGYYYSIIRPEDLSAHLFWKRIPLIILTGLLNGEIRPRGTTVSAASEEGVSYRISGLEGEISVPSAFAEYLRTIGTIDQMVSMNIMANKIADIVKSELIELAQKCEAPCSREGARRQDSKKARAYQLFDSGRRPSDPEVKALGIKPNSVYRYYQEWKKTRNHP